MPERRRTSRRVASILVGVVAITAIVIGVKSRFFGAGRPGSDAGNVRVAREKSALSALSERLRNSEPGALATAQEDVMPRPDRPPQALSEAQAAGWIEVLSGLRTGYLRFKAPARAVSVTVACRILDKFAVEPAPARWLDVLQPLHDVLSAALADPDPFVRYQALKEVSRLWVWVPGRSLMPVEETALAEWKGKIHPAVVRCLASQDSVHTRVAAVACLGTLPIDDAAAPAIPYLEDPSPLVRKQALASFAQRTTLLTDDMLFRRMHDEDASNRETASLILKVRGFKQEQISLGSLIFSPKPAERVSVIPFLKDRTDLDPVVWLIQLSRDPVESVRISAIEALAPHKTPAVQRRLAEMARSDASQAVRQAAGKVVPATDETTAALPPLPGSPSLNPKAN